MKCEKCGYKHASFKKCRKCGRRNPCPIKRTLFYLVMLLAPIVIIAGGVASAQWVAKMRVEAAKAEATSFAAPRDPKAPSSGRGGGGRRSGDLTWQ
ncbi:MAG: hypothetical protein ACKOJB_03440 [Chthoniobacterales bacterium]